MRSEKATRGSRYVCTPASQKVRRCNTRVCIVSASSGIVYVSGHAVHSAPVCCLVFPVSVDECLKLWKRLRDRYTRELKAIEETKRSGSGYVSRRAWEFTESMAFYKHCGRQRKMTCSLELATYGDDGETAESIFATMGNTPPSPSGVESPMDSLQELSMPATSPPLAERPPETGKEEAAAKHKKGKKNDNFEEQLLSKLDSKMGENEAFGISIGLSLDNMPRKVALKCKARIMTLIAEMEEENDVHTINIS
nr:uncharacterized protein LOC119183321 isoform X1 [Rhipicephalus microplus]